MYMKTEDLLDETIKQLGFVGNAEESNERILEIKFFSKENLYLINYFSLKINF